MSTDTLRVLQSITPPQIFAELQKGVLGQNTALRFVSVAVYKHTTGKVPGNILLIGNSGTGKTTIMNNIQRMYHDVPEYRPFRAMTIINANLLVDAERLEFQPERLLAAVEQRARAMVGEKPSPAALRETMERATICIDEIDKMSSVVAGKPNAIGVAGATNAALFGRSVVDEGCSFDESLDAYEDYFRQKGDYRNLAELMQYTSGQFVNVLSRNDANWGGYAGLGPKYNTYMLDGLPIDSFTDAMSLDPWAFERVEIQKGPAAILYSNYLTMDFAGRTVRLLPMPI